MSLFSAEILRTVRIFKHVALSVLLSLQRTRDRNREMGHKRKLFEKYDVALQNAKYKIKSLIVICALQ